MTNKCLHRTGINDAYLTSVWYIYDHLLIARHRCRIEPSQGNPFLLAYGRAVVQLSCLLVTEITLGWGTLGVPSSTMKAASLDMTLPVECNVATHSNQTNLSIYYSFIEV